MSTSYYQTSVPSLLPTPLPTPLPTALPSLTFQPSFLDCEAGFGVFDGGGAGCAACPAGRYASDNGCEACAGGSVPSGGACFPGTWAASRVDNATGAPAHAPGVVDHEGSCYYFEAGGSTWTAAERSCNSLGGHLACVSGPSHARFVAEQAELRGVAAMWIGMSERGNEKAFSWTNPECCSDYRNWYETTDAEGTTTREPTEDIELISYRCVRMGATGELWDENCRAHFGYVCQAPVLSAATACAACRSGTYAASGASTCAACPFGKYARGEGHARCDACPTRSPASLLGTYFAPETTANAGGSVLCGGNLGRAQRSAYIVTSVFTAAGPLLLGTAAVFLQVNVGGFLVSRGLAGWPTRVHAYRSELIPMVFGSSLVASSLLGGALFAAWLQPLRQRSESWPYKGRLAATSLAKGCDPGERHASLVAGTVFLVVAAVCFLCCVPVVDVGAVAREVYRCVVRLRLRRDFLRQTRKWERERAATEAKVKNISSFACTLCRQRRAAALNLPCGHQFLCNECADRFREENGAICNACRAPSDVRDVILRTGASSRKRDDAQEVGPLGNIELAPVKASALERRTSRSASVAELRAAIAATKRARRGAQRRFLASACGVCGESKELVVDTPCGHATLCAACAAEFRGRSPVCSRCGEASEIVAPTLELCCSICFDSVSAQYLVALGACGHQLCTSCSVGYVRSCAEFNHWFGWS